MSTPAAPLTTQLALAQAVQALRAPDAYPTPVACVETIETHFAWVFLAGEHAYKLKKPICFRQFDLSTLPARRYACAEEVRLSRRLAPEVYLGVAPLARGRNGTLQVEAEGEPIEWLVKMRRLPSASMLDRVLAVGPAPAQPLIALGRKLALFYEAQQRVPFAAHDYLRRIAQQIEADCDALRAPEIGLDMSLVDALRAAQLAAYGRVEQGLIARAEANRIVEAHGDLRPEHVCLTEPPCVIDSLEFSFDLRTLDPLEELAYFWVECTHLNAGAAAETVIAAWREASGEAPDPPLFDFYCSRRAAVRAKVIAWHLLDPCVRLLAPWRTKAQAYVEAAIRCADRE